jgi:hypothetical protein
VEKRVVSVRIGECGDRAKGVGGRGPPPADSWTWRKYGQKPIKGSPYPRYASLSLSLGANLDYRGDNCWFNSEQLGDLLLVL